MAKILTAAKILIREKEIRKAANALSTLEELEKIMLKRITDIAPKSKKPEVPTSKL